MSMSGQGSSNADEPLAALDEPQDGIGFAESPEVNRGAEGLNEP